MFYRSFLKDAYHVAMATCLKFNDVHYKIPHKKRKSLLNVKKRIVYDSLKVEY